MLPRPIDLSLLYCVKDNVVLQALCPSSIAYTRNLNPQCLIWPSKGKVGYE